MQKINTEVFKNPDLLMQNIVNITNYYRQCLMNDNEDINRGTLTIIKTKDDNNFFKTANNEYYRMYNYIENTLSYDTIDNDELSYNVGKAFGKFVKVLNNYPIEKLYETIPNFHNSVVRLETFKNDIKKDSCNRVKDVLPEISFILNRSDTLSIIVDLLNSGEIPYRVTHNDTKVNNVLMDVNTNEGICVIDLDTVMPGSALYDFGDAMRTGAASIIEDDPNLDKVTINMNNFKSFTKGYLSETKDILTEKEIDNLAVSCIIITLEQAMRFLNDYINGDTYFKCKYDKHNLVRTRNQLKLVSEMERHLGEMKNIVKEYSGNNTVKKQVKKISY